MIRKKLELHPQSLIELQVYVTLHQWSEEPEDVSSFEANMVMEVSGCFVHGVNNGNEDS